MVNQEGHFRGGLLDISVAVEKPDSYQPLSGWEKLKRCISEDSESEAFTRGKQGWEGALGWAKVKLQT